MYKIRDLQFECRYFADEALYENKEQIMVELADYHNIDYSGVKQNDEPYKDIWEFLNTLKDDETRLNWLLEYGQWEIEEVETK
jgi:hypothetical protein